MASRAGLRFGKFQFRGSTPRTAPLVVLGAGVPGMTLDLLKWAYDLHGIEMPDFRTRNQALEVRRSESVNSGRRKVHQHELSGVLDVQRSLGDASRSRAARIRNGKMPAAFAGAGFD